MRQLLSRLLAIAPLCSLFCASEFAFAQNSCQIDAECSLGERCVGAVCVADVRADRDRDGVPEGSPSARIDNCPDISNPGQKDADGDGRGDACDSDVDGDGVDNETDNCMLLANPDQSDRNGDGRGDACEPDSDWDGVPDDIDNCLLLSAAYTANPDQRDSDGDGIGDLCDPDDDSDGVVDLVDACPLAYKSWCNVSLAQFADSVVDASALLQTRITRAPFSIQLPNDVNDPPTAIGFDVSVAENLPQGPVGYVLVSDPDPGDIHTFRIVSGNTTAQFGINRDTGEVISNRPLNFEIESLHRLGVTVTDAEGLSDTDLVLVRVIDRNEAPTVSGFSATISENMPGSFIGGVTGADPDAGDSIRFRVTQGNDAGLFAIASEFGDVTTLAPLDYELAPKHELVVTAIDALGATDSSVVTVEVLDVNEPPVVTGFDARILESQPATSVGQVVAADPEGQAVIFSIVAGNEGGLFAISPTSGALKTTGPLDYEQQSQHILQVTARDPDGLVGVATVSIDVADVDESGEGQVVRQVLVLSAEQSRLNGTVTDTTGVQDLPVPGFSSSLGALTEIRFVLSSSIEGEVSFRNTTSKSGQFLRGADGRVTVLGLGVALAGEAVASPVGVPFGPLEEVTTSFGPVANEVMAISADPTLLARFVDPPGGTEEIPVNLNIQFTGTIVADDGGPVTGSITDYRATLGVALQIEYYYVP